MKKNPFEQFGTGLVNETKEIEKSFIFDALNRDTAEKMGIYKKGSEIKQQIIGVVIPDLKAHYDEKIAIINDLLGKVGLPPTEDFCCWRIKIDMPFKKYTWEETYWGEKEVDEVGDEAEISIFNNFAEVEPEAKKINKNLPTSKEEAKNRNEYNKMVDCLYDLLLDVKTCNILVNNLNDDESYKLTVEQLTSLLF